MQAHTPTPLFSPSRPPIPNPHPPALSCWLARLRFHFQVRALTRLSGLFLVGTVSQMVGIGLVVHQLIL